MDIMFHSLPRAFRILSETVNNPPDNTQELPKMGLALHFPEYNIILRQILNLSAAMFLQVKNSSHVIYLMLSSAIFLHSFKINKYLAVYLTIAHSRSSITHTLFAVNILSLLPKNIYLVRWSLYFSLTFFNPGLKKISKSPSLTEEITFPHGIHPLP